MFIPAMSGRKRYNVLVAINAITHDLHCICNETYINALSVCDLIKQIGSIKENDNPITIVMDNARYQRCNLVKQFAESLNIELLFLPGIAYI